MTNNDDALIDLFHTLLQQQRKATPAEDLRDVIAGQLANPADTPAAQLRRKLTGRDVPEMPETAGPARATDPSQGHGMPIEEPKYDHSGQRIEPYDGADGISERIAELFEEMKTRTFKIDPNKDFNL